MSGPLSDGMTSVLKALSAGQFSVSSGIVDYLKLGEPLLAD
jgi:hypothetical protein